MLFQLWVRGNNRQKHPWRWCQRTNVFIYCICSPASCSLFSCCTCLFSIFFLSLKRNMLYGTYWVVCWGLDAPGLTAGEHSHPSMFTVIHNGGHRTQSTAEVHMERRGGRTTIWINWATLAAKCACLYEETLKPKREPGVCWQLTSDFVEVHKWRENNMWDQWLGTFLPMLLLHTVIIASMGGHKQPIQ